MLFLIKGDVTFLLDIRLFSTKSHKLSGSITCALADDERNVKISLSFLHVILFYFFYFLYLSGICTWISE